MGDNTKGRRMKRMTQIEREFQQSLEASGHSKRTVTRFIQGVDRFLRYIDGQPLNRLSEEQTRAYFARFKGNTRASYSSIIHRFLKFAAAALPVVVDKAGASLPPPTRKPTKKELALRERWTVDKLTAEKETADDLIAKLARQVVNHYVFFEKRLKGAPDDLDELARFADEARALIESNLALFMGLSASGRNINPLFTERILP